MRLIAVSDTHGFHNYVKCPEGDVLIFAGDFNITTENHLRKLDEWMGKQPCKHKIWIAGNHDFYIQERGKEAVREILKHSIYLEDDGVEIEGVRFWGSPWVPIYNSWAFMGAIDLLKDRASRIPEYTDVLVTHGPPDGIMDAVGGKSQGNVPLLWRVKEIRPKIHIFGHIHEGFGQYTDYQTDFYNVAFLDQFMNPVNTPFSIEL